MELRTNKRKLSNDFYSYTFGDIDNGVLILVLNILGDLFITLFIQGKFWFMSVFQYGNSEGVPQEVPWSSGQDTFQQMQCSML